MRWKAILTAIENDEVTKKDIWSDFCRTLESYLVITILSTFVRISGLVILYITGAEKSVRN